MFGYIWEINYIDQSTKELYYTIFPYYPGQAVELILELCLSHFLHYSRQLRHGLDFTWDEAGRRKKRTADNLSYTVCFFGLPSVLVSISWNKSYRGNILKLKTVPLYSFHFREIQRNTLHSWTSTVLQLQVLVFSSLLISLSFGVLSFFTPCMNARLSVLKKLWPAGIDWDRLACLRTARSDDMAACLARNLDTHELVSWL